MYRRFLTSQVRLKSYDRARTVIKQICCQNFFTKLPPILINLFVVTLPPCRHGNYGERLMAFFNPHSTGRHSFFASNDDSAQVWLAEGHNLTAAYQNR